MKNLMILSVLFLASVLFSCGGGSSSSSTPTPSGLSFKANGVQKNFVSATSTSAGASATVLTQNGQYTYITIAAISSATGDHDSFVFTPTINPAQSNTSVVGTYSIGLKAYSEKRGNSLNGWTPCTQSSGKTFTLTITAYDAAAKTMQGTFSGTLCASGLGDMVISGGTFNIPVR